MVRVGREGKRESMREVGERGERKRESNTILLRTLLFILYSNNWLWPKWELIFTYVFLLPNFYKPML